MCIKQLYNDNLRKLPNDYGDVSVMYGVRPLVARTQSLKSSFSCFICLKVVGYLQHHL